jgi:hypothetical protein
VSTGYAAIRQDFSRDRANLPTIFPDTYDWYCGNNKPKPDLIIKESQLFPLPPIFHQIANSDHMVDIMAVIQRGSIRSYSEENMIAESLGFSCDRDIHRRSGGCYFVKHNVSVKITEFGCVRKIMQKKSSVVRISYPPTLHGFIHALWGTHD